MFTKVWAENRKHIFLFLVAFASCFVLSSLFLPLFVGIIAAYISEDVINFFMKISNRTKEVWRYFFSILFIVLLTIVFAGPISLFISMSIHDLTQLIQNSEAKYAQFEFRDDLVRMIKQFTDQIGFSYSVDEIFIKIVEITQDVSKSILLFISNALFETPRTILQFIIFLLTWIIFLVHGPSFRARLLPILVPWEQERHMISSSVGNTLRALIVANLFVSLIQCFIVTVTFGLAGIPRFAVWGLLSFFASFIPIVGTAPITLGAAAWCYFSEQNSIAAIIILAVGVCVGILDNILRPLFMKGGVQLNFFWIFLAIVGGIAQFGFAGVVIGPVLFSIFVALVKEIEGENQ